MSLAKLREEHNKLRNCLRLAKKSGLSSDVIRSLAGQFHQLLRQYNKTSRLEQRLSGEKAVRRERKQCVERFSAFAKKILEGVSSPSISGPAFDEQMAQEFFTDIYRSNNAVFQHPNWLPHPATPSHPFEEGPITSEELDRVLGKVRQRASPSPLDQVSYSVLRRCPSLQPALLHIFNICWAQQLVPRSWKEEVIRLIPKSAAEEPPDLPSNFRPIALTSCVGKLFTSILKNRWLSFLVTNSYLDTRVQKAFLPGVPGCVEDYQKLLTTVKDGHQLINDTGHLLSVVLIWPKLMVVDTTTLLPSASSITTPLGVSRRWFETSTLI